MNRLLVAATAKEISPFLSHYRQNDNSSDIDILITGVGLVAATYSLLKQVTIKRPSLIIQAGIGGCFDKNIPLASVVVIKQEAIADLSVMENKDLRTMFDLGFLKKNRPPFKNGWLVNPHSELIKESGLKAVKAISVNHITSSITMQKLYQKKFNPVAESMEGAALHYVALLEGIPFLQIRSLSNYIGERNKSKWRFVPAVENLNKTIIRITENIK